MNVLSFNDRMKMMDNYYYFSRGTKKEEKKVLTNETKHDTIISEKERRTK